jgi:hypothetical protein
MPYKTRKVRGKNCYKVYKTTNKKVFSNCTSKVKATKQMRLLRAIQFNKKFMPNSKQNKKRIGGTRKKRYNLSN